MVKKDGRMWKRLNIIKLSFLGINKFYINNLTVDCMKCQNRN